MAPNSANGSIPSLIAWTVPKPPGNAATVSEILGTGAIAPPDDEGQNRLLDAVRSSGAVSPATRVFVERLWRSVKYKDIYLRSYEAVPELHRELTRYFAFSNDERLHQSLDYRTPAAVYRDVSAKKA